MTKSMYFVTIDSYDWFTGQQRNVRGFSTLMEAWEFYKSNSKYDFDYGDHYKDTRKPVRAKDADAIVLPKQRPHARTKQEYDAWFVPYKCKPFLVPDVVCEIVVVEHEEEEYLFDDGELLF